MNIMKKKNAEYFVNTANYKYLKWNLQHVVNNSICSELVPLFKTAILIAGSLQYFIWYVTAQFPISGNSRTFCLFLNF